MGSHVDTGSFITQYLLDMSKTTYKNMIGVGGTITTIAQALGHGGKFSIRKPHFLGGNVDTAILIHMTITNTEGSINKYPHHKQILFTFLVVARTTIANKRNQNCDKGDNKNEEHGGDDGVKGEEKSQDAQEPIGT